MSLNNFVENCKANGMDNNDIAQEMTSAMSSVTINSIPQLSALMPDMYKTFLDSKEISANINPDLMVIPGDVLSKMTQLADIMIYLKTMPDNQFTYLSAYYEMMSDKRMSFIIMFARTCGKMMDMYISQPESIDNEVD